MSSVRTPSRRILMLAPEPVLQPRGTPLSVFHRLRALSALGYEVDLVTYPLGEPIAIPGVRVLRVWRPWGLRRIKIGPSAPKLVLDALLAATALGCLLRRRYAAIHSHEEAVFIAAVYARVFRLPHLYDMHSSLPQQFSNWRTWYARPASRLASRMEHWAIRHSDVLITICPALADHVRAVDSAKPHLMIENAMTVNGAPSAEDARVIRARYGLNGAPLIVYVGNFEPYQGVDLLLDSFVWVQERLPQARLLIIGGTRDDIARRREGIRARKLDDAVHFTGTVAPEHVAAYLDAGDVLVSPRVSGTNTPLKLYAYLKAGKPIVATDLPTHTQVLSPEVAVLASAQPQAFGQALLEVLSDAPRAAALGRRARAFAEAHYDEASYTQRVAQAYQWLLEERA